MKNTYQPGTTTSKSIRTLPARKPNANPSNLHASRKGATVKRPRSSSSGMQGLSIGQKVPMNIFQQKYTKPNQHGMAQVVDANTIKKKTKKALGGKQKQFFGL